MCVRGLCVCVCVLACVEGYIPPWAMLMSCDPAPPEGAPWRRVCLGLGCQFRPILSLNPICPPSRHTDSTGASPFLTIFRWTGLLGSL